MNKTTIENTIKDIGIHDRPAFIRADCSVLLDQDDNVRHDECIRDALQTIHAPVAPVAAIFGGDRVADTLAVMATLLPDRVDRILVGGGVAFTFLHAMGCRTGSSRVDHDQIRQVRAILAQAEACHIPLVLPIDVVATGQPGAGSSPDLLAAEAIPDGWTGCDIGPATVGQFAGMLAGVRTILWHGPMGKSGQPVYARGTLAMARVVADCAAAVSVIGGKETTAAVRQAGVAAYITHLLTEGSAFMEMLCWPTGNRAGERQC
jgi:phosphoglycerate kinase